MFNGLLVALHRSLGPTLDTLPIPGYRGASRHKAVLESSLATTAEQLSSLLHLIKTDRRIGTIKNYLKENWDRFSLFQQIEIVAALKLSPSLFLKESLSYNYSERLGTQISIMPASEKADFIKALRTLGLKNLAARVENPPTPIPNCPPIPFFDWVTCTRETFEKAHTSPAEAVEIIEQAPSEARPGIYAGVTMELIAEGLSKAFPRSSTLPLPHSEQFDRQAIFGSAVAFIASTSDPNELLPFVLGEMYGCKEVDTLGTAAEAWVRMLEQPHYIAFADMFARLGTDVNSLVRGEKIAQAGTTRIRELFASDQ